LAQGIDAVCLSALLRRRTRAITDASSQTWLLRADCATSLHHVVSRNLAPKASTNSTRATRSRACSRWNPLAFCKRLTRWKRLVDPREGARRAWRCWPSLGRWPWRSQSPTSRRTGPRCRWFSAERTARGAASAFAPITSPVSLLQSREGEHRRRSSQPSATAQGQRSGPTGASRGAQHGNNRSLHDDLGGTLGEPLGDRVGVAAVG